ncbi:MAG TPA: DUF202 domain-containing protein [Gaiellaceae bacterium]|nr:DUF202 domain-containing protein [Gaiellaceae bacterium]
MEVEDATRRTRLATERTYLAWWRSGLTALAVGLAAGKLVPELSAGASWPYELLGAGYSLLGIAFIFYGIAGSTRSRLPYGWASGRRSTRESRQA